MLIFFPAMELKPPKPLPPTKRDVSMRDLISQYKVLSLDSYGVLRGRMGAYPGVELTLREILRQGKQIAVASNASAEMPEEIQRNWQGKGVHIPLDLIFTSGQVLALYVAENRLEGSYAICLGNAGTKKYARMAGLRTIPDSNIMKDYRKASVVIVGENPTFFNQKRLDAAVNAVIASNAHVVQSTTDRMVPYFSEEPRGISVGVESTAMIIRGYTGVEPVIIGKPAQGMFNMLAAALEARGIPKSAVLFVGDNRYEDIAGATMAGFDCLLVESGISGAIDRGEIRGPIANFEQQLIGTGIHPTYQLPSVLLAA
ncbi:MAG: HAD hydrolase-like protein [Candidatus Saganbacteria bacterium]|nr:HAD hydrolase-like protein [Candidatus Saganbacteria bacterium]